MTMTQERNPLPDAANPFGEVFEQVASEAAPGEVHALTDLTESPFEEVDGSPVLSEVDRLLEAALDELRDDAFDEAVATLAGEIEEAIGERFSDEGSRYASERAQLGQALLTPLGLAAETYLDRLIDGLTGTDLQSLDEDRLTDLLDRFDPSLEEVTPAGEEFLGALVRKAKSVVRVVANTAKSVGQFAGRLIGPALERLKALVRPLLRRVLAMAIGRLPVPLQAPARLLAARLTGEAADDREETSPTQPTDPAGLTASFDLALAEAIVLGPDRHPEVAFLAEHADGEGGEYREERPLEQLADARAALIDHIAAAGDEEHLEPAIEQFVPVLLGALRLGINLVGRPRVVSFLSQYLAHLIARWVGPTMSGALSKAIVDTGLRLISLEAPDDRDEAGPVMLAGAIEDTVRRLSEYDDYVLDDQELAQLAVAESFRRSVSSGFPAKLVRSNLQQGPSLGGTFVGRRVRALRPYRKYSRTPEIELTEQVADRLPSFGGTSVGAVLRAAGFQLPMKVRLHLYEAMVGTSLGSLLRADRGLRGLPHGRRRLAMVHPLSTNAAGLLLREPGLGVATPAAYQRSPFHVAVGQRFFVLEPAAASLTLPSSPVSAAIGPPSRLQLRYDRSTRTLRAAMYLSESESQELATAIRAGRGLPAFLSAITAAMERPGAHLTVGRGGFVRELGADWETDEHEGMGAVAPRRQFRRQLRSWILPALAPWFRVNADAVARAAAHPSSGLTVTAVVRLASGRPAAGDVSLTVAPGRRS